jgi:hypothetical protein
MTYFTSTKRELHPYPGWEDDFFELAVTNEMAAMKSARERAIKAFRVHTCQFDITTCQACEFPAEVLSNLGREV